MIVVTFLAPPSVVSGILTRRKKRVAGADFTRLCARDVFMSCLIGVVLAATGCGLELLEGAVQAFLMGRGEGLKLYPDPVRA